MSTVDAHDIHAAIQEVANQGRIVRGLTRHGNHDANRAIGGGFAERFNRVLFKQGRARIEFGEGLLDRTSVPVLVCKFVKQGHERVERGDHMGFQAAKRTERDAAEVLLQFADVVPAQAQIMDEISRALTVAQRHVIEFLAKMLFRFQHLKPNGLES